MREKEEKLIITFHTTSAAIAMEKHCKANGLPAAAEQLYLAQSTVSGHITALEKELGVTLLLRTGKRKIALTEEGRKVYTHAKVILQNCADLTRQLMEHAHLELTLAASSLPMQ